MKQQSNFSICFWETKALQNPGSTGIIPCLKIKKVYRTKSLLLPTYCGSEE